MTAPGATYLPATFSELPSWEQDDHLAALRAFIGSCDRVMAAVKSGAATGKTSTPPGLLSACEDARAIARKKLKPADARLFFESHFLPHRVRHPGAEGLLTGYYEPLIEGARKPDGSFLAPVYKRPADLVNLVDEADRGTKGGLTHARRTAKGIVPFATRSEIEQGALAGQNLELLYLKDPVEVFFMQIQGSGRIKLTDGSTIRVSYDGKNGHPYTSIGRYLIDKGIAAADRMSLQMLADWLRADPERGQKVMWQNASYVFFRELTGPQANYALGVHDIPLTPGRSLAVDTGYHPLGMPIYVSAPKLTQATFASGFNRLMIAQDVGSAIRGPERGDIFFGSGHAAGKLAGSTKAPGNFFVLLPRADAPGTQEAHSANPAPPSAPPRSKQ